MSVTTAVIAVRGIGTRGFPLTTAIEKCMLPIYCGSHSRPLIDFIVDDCVRAGLTRIIFVTTERGQVQLQDYFGEMNPVLQERLGLLGKTKEIEAEISRRQQHKISYDYVVSHSGKYGTTMPLYLSRDMLRQEDHFVMMSGDDFVYHPNGTSELKLALETWVSGQTDHVIMGNPVPRTEAPNYGILQVDDNGHLIDIDEKPPLERVPTNPVVNISRYLFSKSIWPFVENEIAQQRGVGEHYITYPIAAAIKDGQTFRVHPVTGHYLDGGTYDGLLRASNYITENPPVQQV